MTVRERVRQSALSVVESDFANEHETIEGLRRRIHPPKPPVRKRRRRKQSA